MSVDFINPFTLYAKLLSSAPNFYALKGSQKLGLERKMACAQLFEFMKSSLDLIMEEWNGLPPVIFYKKFKIFVSNLSHHQSSSRKNQWLGRQDKSYFSLKIKKSSCDGTINDFTIFCGFHVIFLNKSKHRPLYIEHTCLYPPSPCFVTDIDCVYVMLCSLVW